MAFGSADRRGAIANARTWEARARLSNKEERNMRAILIPALAALGIALAGTSATMAAPAYGEVIGQAAYANQAVQPVYWRHYSSLALVAASLSSPLVVISAPDGPGTRHARPARLTSESVARAAR
jgi:hypothetical protein